MISRTILALPGALISLALLAAPAYADSGMDVKHRLSHSHPRTLQPTRSTRSDRYLRARHWLTRTPRTDLADAAEDVDNSDDPEDNQPLGREVFESGFASWYGLRHQGRATSSGVPFDANQLTAAHPWLPLGSRIRVRLVGTNRTVEVTVTDRPGNRHRIIDLSRAAARELGMIRHGTALVALSRL